MPFRSPVVVYARYLVAPILIAGVLMTVTGPVGAVPAEGQGARGSAIRSIQTAASGPTVVVTIQATGPLPLPTSGVVGGPPRIYLDFPGVALNAPALTASADSRIRRIRTGVHSATPLVTRVVIDLVALEPYRVERSNGGISVIVGAPATQPSLGIAPVARLPDEPPAVPPAREPVMAPTIPREPTPTTPSQPAPAPLTLPPAQAVPSLPAPVAERPLDKVVAPPAPAHSRASPSPGRPLPAKDLETYRRLIAPALDRLRLQQPLLTSLDGAEDQTVDRIQLAVEEFERLRSELTGIKPPETLRSQHDMLFQATTLALMATRLRLEAFRTTDPATLRNAASAAAGATLLLDRACADLGCPESGR
jgi:hypothetical protein